MINRKQIELDRFKEDISKTWQLSVVENSALESFLELFLAGKNHEIKKVEHLLNDETEELLELLNDREVINYVTENWDFISPEDESDLVDALDNLNFDWIEKCDFDKMVQYIEENGYSVEEEVFGNMDIVTQSQLQELQELFLNLSTQEREKLLNKIR